MTKENMKRLALVLLSAILAIAALPIAVALYNKLGSIT